ncbi:MAG: hypothetical protein IKK75_12500 [Clostridia bacterium]|nr:hypothetical protein [Clostridia bacterium]
MKLGKVVLLALGIALLALGVKRLMDIPGQQAMLNDAVYLDEAVILPENEGKLVIIHGKPEMTVPAYDEELGLTLNTIKAYRYDEEYKLKSSEKLLYQYGWMSKSSKGIVGKASLGEFALDEKTLNGFAADSEYEDFDMAEISAKGYAVARGKTAEDALTDRWYVIVGGTYYYDAFEYSGDLSIPHVTREMDKAIADEREGAKAYAYKVYTGANYDEVTVAGIQHSGSLVTHEKLGSLVKEGVLTKEQVISSYARSTALGRVLVHAVPGVLLIFFGLCKPKARTKTKEA